MIRRRAGGNNCAGDPDISCGVTMRWSMPTRPLWPLKLSQPGDRQHGLRPSPAGRSAILTARTLLIAAGVHRTFLIIIGPVRQRDARPFHP